MYNRDIYVFNGEDITMNVFLQIHAVLKVIQRRLEIEFLDALDLFYASETYQTLRDVENGLWAEDPEYIADRFMEEKDGGKGNQEKDVG